MADFNPKEFDINYQTTPSPVPTQRANADVFNTDFTSFLNSQETVPQIQDRYNNQYGVPDLQNQIQRGTQQYDYLGNQILDMPNSIAQRSQESILTQGQKDRQVQAESAPLLQQQGMVGQNLSRTQQNLGVAQTNVGQMMNAEQAQQLKMTQPWMMKHEDNNILNAAEMTGWTFQNSQELDKLLANQSAGVTLTEGERTRLNQLAMKEKEFENNIKLQQMKNDSALATYSPYSNKAPENTIYNTQTGGQKGYQIVSA